MLSFSRYKETTTTNATLHISKFKRGCYVSKVSQPPKLILKPDGGCTSETDNCEGKCSGDESEARAQVLV